MSEPAPAECARCGKCCFEPFYRHVRPEDERLWSRAGRADLIAVCREEETRRDNLNPEMAALGLALCTCRFLRSEGPGRFGCAIHELRPVTCREFEPGCSRLCPQYRGKRMAGRDERDRHGII